MREFEGSIGRTGWSLGSLLLAGVASSVLTTPAEALTIVPTFTTLVSTQAQSAFNLAATQYDNLFTDPVQVNIKVQTGTTGLGSSSTPLLGIPGTTTYSGMRAALLADYAANPSANRTTAAGVGGSINTTTDPTGGGTFLVARADAKALRLIPTDTVSDGTFTFNRNLSYTFDNTAAPGKFDLVGVSEHEISEIMGRISLLGANLTGNADFLPYELFRYQGAGVRGITSNGAGNFFSINNGTLDLKDYNNAVMNGGDAQDWATVGPTFDPTDMANFSTGPDQAHSISTVDVTAMNVIGWDTKAVPAPSIGHGFLVFLAAGGLLLGAKLLDRAKRAIRVLGVA